MSATKRGTPKGKKTQENATRAQTSQTRTTRKANQNITAPEALQLLESAVSYCQQAGLQVRAANQDDGALAVFIPNAHYVLTDDGAQAAFRLTTGATL